MNAAILDRILAVNLAASTAVFFAAARIYLLPRLEELGARRVLVPILLLHSMRHLGLMFLTRGAVYPGLPETFAYPAAFGDLLTAALAFGAIPAVLWGWRTMRWQVLVFNVVGSLDLIDAIARATISGAPRYMGPAYWIPAFWVPGLLVTHYVVFRVLWTRPCEARV